MDQTIVGNDFVGCYRVVMDDQHVVHFLNGHGREMLTFDREEGFSFADGFSGPRKELMEHIIAHFNSRD